MESSNWKTFCGQTVEGKFLLRKLLGNGAFGGVFLADEMVAEQAVSSVAIKLIDPSGSPLDMQMRELQLLRNLNHPHLVRGLSVGECELYAPTRSSRQLVSLLYVVMDVAEGALSNRLERGTLSVSEARELTQQVCEGLAYLHSCQIVHRDLKPANVLRSSGRWQVADFGITKAVGDNTAVFTEYNAGTKTYMPPEGFNGIVSPAGDVWALGVMLVQALTGQFPFTNLEAILIAPPAIPSRLPAPFDAIVAGCLQKDRKARWTIPQVLNALAGARPSQPLPAPHAVKTADTKIAVPSPASRGSQKKTNALLSWTAAIVLGSGFAINRYISQPASVPPAYNYKPSSGGSTLPPANVAAKPQPRTAPVSSKRDVTTAKRTTKRKSPKRAVVNRVSMPVVSVAKPAKRKPTVASVTRPIRPKLTVRPRTRTIDLHGSDHIKAPPRTNTASAETFSGDLH